MVAKAQILQKAHARLKDHLYDTAVDILRSASIAQPTVERISVIQGAIEALERAMAEEPQEQRAFAVER